MNSVRIIGGKYKGKKIPVLHQATLRPTPNRIRETLFNWLMHDIRNAVCLDAFAGSGALGFEALSRGAQQVTLIEKQPETFASLQQTANAFDVSSIELLQTDFFDYLKKSPRSFDIIFLDPPFHADLLMRCFQELSQSSLIKPQGLIYVESDRPLSPHPQWTSLREQHAGLVYYGLYQNTIIA